MAYTRVNWENYPSTNTPRNATNLNVMDEGLFNQDARITVNETEIDNIQTGWNLANETWTYSSVDDPTGVITIVGDKTSKYSLGMRIKFTNGGNIIYGIITKISYSSPNTTLTFLHEINTSTGNSALHLMQNSAITNNYYSSMKAPYGFPMSKTKWTLSNQITSSTSQVSPVDNTWYNIGGSLTVPIGLWIPKYSGLMAMTRSSMGNVNQFITISTTNNGNTNLKYTQKFSGYGNIEVDISVLLIGNPLLVESPTTYYLNCKKDDSSTGQTGIYLLGTQQTTILQFECAYL